MADLRGELGEVLTQQNDMERTFEERLNRQGPPISAVGSLQPPPYARTPSLEFQTPPQEFMPIVDIPLSPPSPTALPIPPPVSQFPIPFLDQEITPPSCCANPPVTEAPLIPVEVESNDAEGSEEVEESAMGRVDEEAINQLWRNNQSRAAGQRVVRASNLVHPHPYAYAKGLGDFWARRARFLRRVGGDESSNEGGSSWEDCILPH